MFCRKMGLNISDICSAGNGSNISDICSAGKWFQYFGYVFCRKTKSEKSLLYPLRI
jgi:hypothetical protein